MTETKRKISIARVQNTPQGPEFQALLGAYEAVLDRKMAQIEAKIGQNATNIASIFVILNDLRTAVALAEASGSAKARIEELLGNMALALSNLDGLGFPMGSVTPPERDDSLDDLIDEGLGRTEWRS